MPYSSKAIANLFLEIARADGSTLSQMKLQKLVYMAHGWNLAILGTPLIEDTVEAWQYGPVIPTLYSEFRGFGSSPITEDATIASINENTFSILYEVPRIRDEDHNTRNLIKNVWQRYGELTGPNLSDLTHRAGTPWSETFRHAQAHLVINNDLIKEHFTSLLGGN